MSLPLHPTATLPFLAPDLWSLYKLPPSTAHDLRDHTNMVKPLSFKGDKKPKKRKRTENPTDAGPVDDDARSAQVQKLDEEPDNDDSWVAAEAVADISGPVMIVLPTDTPTALASDPSGKVFTIPIENIVDGNPATAEPHDVRQVWVANKISGTENYRFKGHHGK